MGSDVASMLSSRWVIAQGSSYESQEKRQKIKNKNLYLVRVPKLAGDTDQPNVYPVKLTYHKNQEKLLIKMQNFKQFGLYLIPSDVDQHNVELKSELATVKGNI